MRPGLLLATALLVSAVGISTWLAAADYATIPPRGEFHERDAPAIVLTGAAAKARRADALRRATFLVPRALHASSPDNPLPDPLRLPVPS